MSERLSENGLDDRDDPNMVVHPESQKQPLEPEADAGIASGGTSNQPFNWLMAYALVLLTICYVCAAATALTTFPLSEGWYETLVYLEHHGLKAYTNVEFVLPPMTLIYYHFFDFLSHSQFAVTKLVGLTLTLSNCGLIYLWLKPLLKRSSVILSVVISFIILTTEPLYLASDYHDLVQVFITVAFIVALRPTTQRYAWNAWLVLTADAALGAIMQALFLTKQNTGLGIGLTLAFLYSGRLLIALVRREPSRSLLSTGRLCAFLIGFAVAGFVILTLAGIHQSYFAFVHYLVSIQSKGSFVFAATRLLHDDNNYTELMPGFVLAIAGIFLYLVVQYVRQIQRAGLLTIASIFGSRFPQRYVKVATALAFVAVPIFVFKYAFNSMLAIDPVYLWNSWPTTLAVAAYLVDLFSTISKAVSGRGLPWFRTTLSIDATRVLLFGALFYSNSLTASVNVLSIFVMFSYYAAIAIDAVFSFASLQSVVWLRSFLFATAAIVTLFAYRLEISKLQVPYSWWGMQESPVFAASDAADLPYLRGLRFEPARAAMLRTIVSEISANTSPTDPILTFPDIPLFYMLSDRLPMTRTYLQWFDFATNASLIPDFKRISESPPKMIVELSVPKLVYDGHEGLLGRPLPQRPFAQYLNCLVATNAFTELNSFYYARTDALNGAFRLKTTHTLSAADIDRIAAVTLSATDGSLLVTRAIGLDDTELAMSDIRSLPDKKADEFRGVVLQGKGEHFEAVVNQLNLVTHAAFTVDQDHYMIHVLKRTPSWRKNGTPCRATLLEALKKF